VGRSGCGESDGPNRQNVRRRLLLPAIERTNVKLAEDEIETIGEVDVHGLRRTFASHRCAVGDDPAYTRRRIGHTTGCSP